LKEGASVTSFLHFLNKLINPLVELKTEEELLEFLELQKEHNESTKFFSKKSLPLGNQYSERVTKTRAVAFIYDKEDYVEELRNLKYAGRFSAKREELRIGVVYDKKIIKKYKAKYGSTWFSDVTYTTLIVKRYDEQVFFFDYINGNPSITPHFWINKKSIKEVEQINQDTFRLFELIRQPIIIAFVDFNTEESKVRKNSIKLVDEVMKEVAPAFFHGAIFAYADNNEYFKYRKIMGITHSKVPAISINNNEQKVVPYPEDSDFSVKSFKSWVTKFMKGELKPKESGFGEVIDVDIKYMLQSTV